jgi:hypothetical protein
VRLCNLNVELSKLLGEELEVPKLRDSRMRRPFEDYYTKEMFARVHPWAKPDVRRWGRPGKG